MTSKLKLVFDAKAELGEGPCWDADNELLYWTDIWEKVFISTTLQAETIGRCRSV